MRITEIKIEMIEAGFSSYGEMSLKHERKRGNVSYKTHPVYLTFVYFFRHGRCWRV